jgi:hypothetical protein
MRRQPHFGTVSADAAREGASGAIHLDNSELPRFFMRYMIQVKQGPSA